MTEASRWERIQSNVTPRLSSVGETPGSAEHTGQTLPRSLAVVLEKEKLWVGTGQPLALCTRRRCWPDVPTLWGLGSWNGPRTEYGVAN